MHSFWFHAVKSIKQENLWSLNVPCKGFAKIGLLFLQVDDFLQALIKYDKEHIPENCLKVVKELYLKDPEFNPNLVHTKSFAAAGLCAWVINIVKFYEVPFTNIFCFLSE